MKNVIKTLTATAIGSFNKTKFIILLLTINSIGMAQNKKTESPKSKVEISENKLRDFYQSYIAAANARNYDAIANVVAEEVMLNGKMVKREDIISQFKILIDAMPDFKWNLQQLVVNNGEIGARLRDSGTPGKSTFFGENSKGKSVEFTEFGSYKVKNGFFVEMWFLIDVTTIAEQLKN